jgi:hypothetical protein
MQAFFLAMSKLAKAGEEANAATAATAKINFMRTPNGGFKYNQTLI